MEIHLRHSGDSSAAADASRPGPLDVATLTRGMVEGNEMAWRAFHDAYFDRLWRYLLVIATGNEDIAREVMQVTFVRVMRHIKIFRDENIFWSWLTVLARTSFADERKKRRRYFSFLDRFTLHSKVGSDSLSDGRTDERLQILLEQKMALLPLDEQKLVEQKYFSRQAVREIADELQTTEKAIESKLSRIRRKLKEAVLKELSDESKT